MPSWPIHARTCSNVANASSSSAHSHRYRRRHRATGSRRRSDSSSAGSCHGAGPWDWEQRHRGSAIAKSHSSRDQWFGDEGVDARRHTESRRLGSAVSSESRKPLAVSVASWLHTSSPNSQRGVLPHDVARSEEITSRMAPVRGVTTRKFWISTALPRSGVHSAIWRILRARMPACSRPAAAAYISSPAWTSPASIVASVAAPVSKVFERPLALNQKWRRWPPVVSRRASMSSHCSGTADSPQREPSSRTMLATRSRGVVIAHPPACHGLGARRGAGPI